MEEQVYYFGSEIKAVDGKVKGYAIRFGSPSDTDLESDYFTPNTDFGRPLKTGDKFSLNLYYHHGQDKTLKTYVIGNGIAEMTDKGIWFEAQLDLANEYGQMIDQLAKDGKLGYSSGSASHLVVRKAVGKSYEIKSWPIAEISLTPQPAESRNKVMKGLYDFVEACKPKKSCPDCNMSMEPNNMCSCSPKKQLCKMCNKPTVKDMCDECGGEMDDQEEEVMVDIPEDPIAAVEVLFQGYEADLVSDSIQDLFEILCNGLYVVLEQGKDISYINALLDGFNERAKKIAGGIYTNPAPEMMMLKLYSGKQPESVRDLEKRLRDVGLSNSQSKSMAGIVWSHLRDVNDKPAETLEVKKTDNDEIRKTLLKKAMLDLL